MRDEALALACAGCLMMGGACTYILDVQKDYTTEEPGTGGASATGSGSVTSGAGGSTTTTSAGGIADAGTGGSTTTTASSGITSGTGGSTTTSSTGVGGSLMCPSGPGPAMVKLGTFCIDATEVTNGDYAAWLATNPSAATQPAACSFNASFTPKNGWPVQPADLDRPVSNVNWCDAHAYCADAGKRLCGHLDGGSLDFNAFADPARSAWMSACSNGGSTAYPYADVYAAPTCNGKDAQSLHTIAVGSDAQCHGPSGAYAALFDMSGNVGEWEDACSGASGPNDTCRRRGGSYKDTSLLLRCDADSGVPRSFTGSGTGFRCCAP